MGDRNNRIMFGPEWPGNLPRESNAGSSAVASGTGNSGADASNAVAISASTITSHLNTPSTVRLNNLRYDREKMLALYDRASEAPPQLQNIDILYLPRGKPPIALNALFEDEMVGHTTLQFALLYKENEFKLNTLFSARFNANSTTIFSNIVWLEGPGRGQTTECQRLSA